MSLTPRQRVIAELEARSRIETHRTASESIADIYGLNVLSLSAMRDVLPKAVYEHLVKTRETGSPLDPAHADAIAGAMKEWAMARGATHFCHWFHPLTGLTAEKHLSFLIPTADGGVLSKFTGADLLLGEPDASSFPSGGIRSTFEARGYTGWDPNGDAFLMQGQMGSTLCIPSVFWGYGGQALDKKTPLLRSTDALNTAALRILRLFGNTQARRVIATVGSEQEYFLIDRRWCLLRPDLLTAGRTLYGARPPKGQEMEDHYFGTIRERALAYMEEVERELYKLAIPVTTRHNEVAPSQYEFAPVFERVEVATDHNLLTMSVMKRVAHRHGMECLLHEKPFAGVNGSGKHNNWSLSDDAGHNLLDPGHTPHDNAQFLVFLTAVIRAVHLHADLLRASVATPGNDHRLGANEAPPAIISIFLGEQLTSVVQAIVAGETATTKPQSYLHIGVAALPPLPRHDSDRNRTSPFAFTGSKFEFRAVGSGQNIATCNMVLNTMVAESLNAIASRIEAAISSGQNLNDAVLMVLQQELREHQAILFNGDSYSEAWHREAEKRGLPNLKDCVEAIPVYVSPKSIELLTQHKVLSREELESRYRIKLEHYIKTIGMEAALMSDLGRTLILPAAMESEGRISSTIAAVKSAREGHPELKQVEYGNRIVSGVTRLLGALDVLDQVRGHAAGTGEDLLVEAKHCRDVMLPAMGEARAAADALEAAMDDTLWPLPKYSEMLFLS
jgi:glutamine synthetase